MTSTGLNTMKETRASEWNHATFYLPTPDFLWNFRSNLLRHRWWDLCRWRGPLISHLMPHCRCSLWWKPASPTPTLFTITVQNDFLGTGWNSCTLMGKKALRKCTTNQGGRNKRNTLNMCESSSGGSDVVTRRVAQLNCRAVVHVWASAGIHGYVHIIASTAGNKQSVNVDGRTNADQEGKVSQTD